ncbi:MAG: restriction endonuclease subunit S [Pseudomonadota bacterium]|jgi:type I restriction enzyme S subunit
MAGEWEVLTLHEAGVTLTDCDHRTPPAAEVGYPYVAIPQLRSGRIEFKDARRISPAHFAEWTRKARSAADDVVLSRRCNPGETAFVAPGSEFALGQNLVLLRADGTRVHTPFLRWLTRGPQWWEQIGKFINVGAVFDNLKCADVPKFELTIPPLAEQRAIAHLLGTLDDKIELNRRRNQTLEAMARALFKDWFVDFGPVRARMEGREPYLPADLWQLFPDRLDDEGKPEGWSERPLDEIADFLNGLALQKFPATDPDDSLPVIKIAELRNGVNAKSDRASREVPAKYIVKDGDFLFSWSGSLLAKFWTEGEGALNQHLFKVTSERYPIWFVSHWMHHHLEEFQAIAASKATTMCHIQRGHLKAAKTLCTPDDVLERLGVVMAPFVEQSIHNELESRTLAQLRDTLLPKLISGKLRVKDAETFLERAT